MDQGNLFARTGNLFFGTGNLEGGLVPTAPFRPTPVADIRQPANVSADMRCFGRRIARAHGA